MSPRKKGQKASRKQTRGARKRGVSVGRATETGPASTAADRRVAQARGLNTGQVQLLQAHRGLSHDALRKIPESVLRRAVRRLDYPDLPRARESFRLLQERDEKGVIPPNALQNALKQLDSTRSRGASMRAQMAGIPTGPQVAKSSLMSPAVPRTAGLHPSHTGWASLGPGNIGGRTRAIVPHPASPNTIWAASVGGGVWRTDNAGASWSPVDDLMANL